MPSEFLQLEQQLLNPFESLKSFWSNWAAFNKMNSVNVFPLVKPKTYQWPSVTSHPVSHYWFGPLNLTTLFQWLAYSWCPWSLYETWEGRF